MIKTEDCVVNYSYSALDRAVRVELVDGGDLMVTASSPTGRTFAYIDSGDAVEWAKAVLALTKDR